MTINRTKAKTCAQMSAGEMKRSRKHMDRAGRIFDRNAKRLEDAMALLELAAVDANGTEAGKACKDLAEAAKAMDKALMTVIDLERKLMDAAPQAGSQAEAAVVDLQEARDEIARRLDRLAA